MKIRRFFAPDTRDAMRQVRAALGPDAVILETTRVEGGVELSAAVDYQPEALLENLPQPRAATAAAAAIATPVARLPDDLAAATTPAPLLLSQDGDFRRLRGEVRTLRELLETELARLTWNDNVRRDAVGTTTMRNLARLGITADVARTVVSALGADEEPTSPWTRPLRELEQRIPVCADDVIANGGIFAVVGPTGVGKTTTIAKLAARYALNNRAEDVALITTDTFRIGAREQLETFGEILGAPVYQAGDSSKLAEVIQLLAGKKLILIDTAGMGQRDVRLARQLSWLVAADSRVRVLLALPANAQTPALQEIVAACAVARPTACILTKTDEAASLGGAISALIRNQLSLAYVTNGQRVPEDLHFAAPRRAWLVKAALELMGQQEDCNEDFMAEHFAEVKIDACA